ncbi:MAG: type II toxin-antitoxin system RatA family toxin, partial [Gammaproteobacteria bacterium]
MPRFHTARELPYPPERLFDLVIDVEGYPVFVPGYHRAWILERGEDFVDVRQSVGFDGLRIEYRSIAHFRRPDWITINSEDAPFRRLHTEWRFIPHQGGCRVDCSVDWQFRSIALGMVAGPILAGISRRMV